MIDRWEDIKGIKTIFVREELVILVFVGCESIFTNILLKLTPWLNGLS